MAKGPRNIVGVRSTQNTKRGMSRFLTKADVKLLRSASSWGAGNGGILRSTSQRLDYYIDHQLPISPPIAIESCYLLGKAEQPLSMHASKVDALLGKLASTTSPERLWRSVTRLAETGVNRSTVHAIMERAQRHIDAESNGRNAVSGIGGRYLGYGNYYSLPLHERFERYQEIMWKLYEESGEILKPYFENWSECIRDMRGWPPFDPQEMRTIKGFLTDELKRIIPTFNGRVIFRLKSRALHYLIRQDDMRRLFRTSVKGYPIGKVISLNDGLLAEGYEKLAGRVVLVEDRGSAKKNDATTAHEDYHSEYYYYPNGRRRDAYFQLLTSDLVGSPDERAYGLIAFDRATLLDESGACVQEFRGFDRRTERGRARKEFLRKYTETVKNAKGVEAGLGLDQLRKSGELDPETVTDINWYEQASMVLPATIRSATKRFAEQLVNPEGSEPVGYALSYLGEALQILDFHEVPGLLASLCVDVLEPNRLEFIFALRHK